MNLCPCPPHRRVHTSSCLTKLSLKEIRSIIPYISARKKNEALLFFLILCQRRICFEQLLRYALPERPTIVFLQLAGECEQVILLFF